MLLLIIRVNLGGSQTSVGIKSPGGYLKTRTASPGVSDSAGQKKSPEITLRITVLGGCFQNID